MSQKCACYVIGNPYTFSPKAQRELVFSAKEQETITGVAFGHITSSQKLEIIFSCFSGAIKSIVDRKQAKKIGATTEDTS